jgi:SAM domain (Sterile alpha motif)
MAIGPNASTALTRHYAYLCGLSCRSANAADARPIGSPYVHSSFRETLGRGKYEAIFRENDIDETVLRSLTHENLKELGVASFGHRVKLLEAIAALSTERSPPVT